MQITDRAYAATIIGSFASTGAKAPKALTEAHARVGRLTAGVRNIQPGDRLLPAAVAAALDAGRDPAADLEVQRLLTARSLSNEGIMQAVDDLAYEQLREVCHEHADSIVAAWRKPFDTAAATGARAAQRIGDLDLRDTDAILLKGGDIAQVWAGAQTAVQVIDTLAAAWQTLAEFARLARTDRRYAMLRIADVDHTTTWQQHQLEGAKPSGWDALRAGLALSLPTFEEYRARLAALERDLARAALDAAPINTARSAVAGRPIRVSV